MIKNFHTIKRSIKLHKEVLMALMEQRFQVLKENDFNYTDAEEVPMYDVEEFMDLKIDCIQAELDHVRTWNYKLHRQRLLRDYENHMKRAGDYIKKEES